MMLNDAVGVTMPYVSKNLLTPEKKIHPIRQDAHASNHDM